MGCSDIAIDSEFQGITYGRIDLNMITLAPIAYVHSPECKGPNAMMRKRNPKLENGLMFDRAKSWWSRWWSYARATNVMAYHIERDQYEDRLYLSV